MNIFFSFLKDNLEIILIVIAIIIVAVVLYYQRKSFNETQKKYVGVEQSLFKTNAVPTVKVKNASYSSIESHQYLLTTASTVNDSTTGWVTSIEAAKQTLCTSQRRCLQKNTFPSQNSRKWRGTSFKRRCNFEKILRHKSNDRRSKKQFMRRCIK